MQNQTLSDLEKLFNIFCAVAFLLIFVGLILMREPFSTKIHTVALLTALVGAVAYILMDQEYDSPG